MQNKEGKKGKKRKNDTKDQNISGENPTNKQTNEQKNSTHSTSKNVNKHIGTQSELTKTNTMTSFCNSPNVVKEKQPYPPYQQYVQPMQPMQPIPSPGFNQMSPMQGYYNMASQSPGNNMIPQSLPLSQSTMNIGPYTNVRRGRDFNSRTASLQDFNDLVDTDDFLAQNLIDINEFSNVNILDKLDIQRKRHSVDLSVNTYGRKLIQLCKNNNMYIMNGRIGNDEEGKPTSKNTSVIDYAISTADVFYLVKNFDVLPFSNLYSDIHCPLELVLSCNNTMQSNVYINVESGENNTYIGKWNHDQVNEYKDNIDKEMYLNCYPLL
ncbi:unnamed protein product [Mytilus coruscus]|uniref:Endonuclease/exonuclease/phosphatase domain-containing protein n=1 Tax=Mytilus coruscus TaxID=42192 RepID=A0A6J8AFF4_MYTCO|nr:unnamed protein product [Mytilus coruscus]